jgi:hypothetical protein
VPNRTKHKGRHRLAAANSAVSFSKENVMSDMRGVTEVNSVQEFRNFAEGEFIRADTR